MPTASTAGHEKEMTSASPITGLLLRWSAGEQGCLDELLFLVEGELRRIAHRRMRMERQGQILQTTALVNEAYLKLVDQSRANWETRTHFLGLAASLVRRILADNARGLCRNKRGGAAGHLPIDEGLVFSLAKSAALVALDDAPREMARADPSRPRVVGLRHFGGLSVEEAAEALHVDPNAVIRDWALARAWLKRELAHEAGDGG
jgi:RNA polymerase sigma factor (TIGR02999 family)